MAKKIIFGAGQIGRMALSHYIDTAYIIDNNPKLWESVIQKKIVRPVEILLEEQEEYMVVIASKHTEPMKKQLQELGINNYMIYEHAIDAFYPTKELIYNPYEENSYRDMSEQEWNSYQVSNQAINSINEEAEDLYLNPKMFNHVEIETINRCNGYCEFCPVSKNKDPREFCEMSQELFEKIINELTELNFSGRISLYSNNEPFLDKQIIERSVYVRNKLPYARIHMFTNGTLLTLEKFVQIVEVLDELIIDNYQQELKLIKPCQEIEKYCEVHPELKKKVTIVLRKPHEILTSRGGDAPNRKNVVSFPKDRCVLPFKQLIIRPDGKVSLCCNDPLGKNTLGDVSKDTLANVWNNDRFKMVRKCLYEGRENWKHCKNCDTFMIG